MIYKNILFLISLIILFQNFTLFSTESYKIPIEPEIENRFEIEELLEEFSSETIGTILQLSFSLKELNNFIHEDNKYKFFKFLIYLAKSINDDTVKPEEIIKIFFKENQKVEDFLQQKIKNEIERRQKIAELKEEDFPSNMLSDILV